MMISDGVNCFSAVPAVSECCNRNMVITVGIIVIVIGPNPTMWKIAGNAKCQLGLVNV